MRQIGWMAVLLVGAGGCSPTFALAKEVKLVDTVRISEPALQPVTLAQVASPSAAPTRVPPRPASREPLAMLAALGNPVVLAGSGQRTFLKVSLTGLKDDRQRAPVNIALVLDRSSSMAGDKIEEAKRAAMMAVDRLGEADSVAVVTYDSTVEVVVPATRVTDPEGIKRAIATITSRGSTALFAGVSVGAKELGAFFARDRVNRVILLSDGQANIGPSSPGELAALGRSLAEEGISVTTLGLGLGYNEDLMLQLALASDGNHDFAENPAELVRIFDFEFGDVLSVAAQQVEVEVRFANGARPIRALGREAILEADRATTRLSQVYGGQEKYLLLEVELPGLRDGQTLAVADVTVAYAGLGTGRRQLHERLSARGSLSPAAVEAATRAEVTLAAVEMLANEQNKLAVLLRDQGQVDKARAVLEDNERFLKRENKKLQSKRLDKLQQVNRDNAANLDDENWQRSRKQMRETQYEFDMQMVR